MGFASATTDGALRGDTLDEEVTRLGLAGLLIEIRQDRVGTKEEAAAFAERLGRLLRPNAQQLT
jgi:predicted N-formylglutamate amidohydrolase